MKFDHENQTIELTRRNLVILLAKLDDPNSFRTLSKDGWAVKAVEDDEHYSDRPHGYVLSETIDYINTTPVLRDLARREYSH